MLQIISSSSKEQRVEQVQQDFSLRFFQSMFLWWLQPRQAIFHTSDATKLAGHMINEVDEVQGEFEPPIIKPVKIGQEVIDVGWLACEILTQNDIEIDEWAIKASINGLGSRSNFFDQTKEVIGNLPLHQLKSERFKKEMEHVFVLILSKLVDMPQYLSPNELIKLVFSKNLANYPKEAFHGYNPLTGKLFDIEEMRLIYPHARACLRAIRDYLTLELHWHDREYGLKREDWLPFLEHIVLPDYTDADVCARHVAEVQRGIKAKYPATVAIEPPSLAVSQSEVDNFLLRQFNAALNHGKALSGARAGQERTVYAS